MSAEVERFFLNKARLPLPLSHAYADIEHWGLESNALVEPWEWAAAEADTNPGSGAP